MQTVISVKVDDDVKESARAVAKSAGLTLSALINSYLRQISITRRIEIFAPETMTPDMEKLIAGIEQEIASGALSPEFSDVEEFLSDLKS